MTDKQYVPKPCMSRHEQNCSMVCTTEGYYRSTLDGTTKLPWVLAQAVIELWKCNSLHVCKSLQSRRRRKSKVLFFPIYNCFAFTDAAGSAVGPNTRKQDPACVILNLQDSAVLLSPCRHLSASSCPLREHPVSVNV